MLVCLQPNISVWTKTMLENIYHCPECMCKILALSLSHRVADAGQILTLADTGEAGPGAASVTRVTETQVDN